jgi:hypothetical protein
MLKLRITPGRVPCACTRRRICASNDKLEDMVLGVDVHSEGEMRNVKGETRSRLQIYAGKPICFRVGFILFVAIPTS